MYKPLFFTAIMSVAACFAQTPASAETSPAQVRAAKQCPEGKVWDTQRKRCVYAEPRGSYN